MSWTRKFGQLLNFIWNFYKMWVNIVQRIIQRIMLWKEWKIETPCIWSVIFDNICTFEIIKIFFFAFSWLKMQDSALGSTCEKDTLAVPRLEGKYTEDTRHDRSLSIKAPISPLPKRPSRIQPSISTLMSHPINLFLPSSRFLVRKSSYPAVSITGPQLGKTELTIK